MCLSPPWQIIHIQKYSLFNFYQRSIWSVVERLVKPIWRATNRYKLFAALQGISPIVALLGPKSASQNITLNLIF